MEFPVIENPARDRLIFDSHAHYDDSRFDDCRDELLASMGDLGVGGIINCSVDVTSAENNLKMSKLFPFCYTAVGFHPENIPDCEPDLSKIEHLCNEEGVVAIGEIGLDYYWEKDKKDQQKDWFREQVLLANRLSLPVIVHDRDAHADTLEILKELTPSGVVHCFSGSEETAAEILSLGMYLGFGGVATFKNSKKCREVIKAVPLERILLETDAPYMAPEPYRGKTCHSGMIIRVAEKIAEIKNVAVETVLEITKKNALALFKIS